MRHPVVVLAASRALLATLAELAVALRTPAATSNASHLAKHRPSDLSQVNPRHKTLDDAERLRLGRIAHGLEENAVPFDGEDACDTLGDAIRDRS